MSTILVFCVAQVRGYLARTDAGWKPAFWIFPYVSGKAAKTDGSITGFKILRQERFSDISMMLESSPTIIQHKITIHRQY